MELDRGRNVIISALYRDYVHSRHDDAMDPYAHPHGQEERWLKMAPVYLSVTKGG
jgi:hypothetical protein